MTTKNVVRPRLVQGILRIGSACLASFLAPGSWHIVQRNVLLGVPTFFAFYILPAVVVDGWQASSPQIILLVVLAKYLALIFAVLSALIDSTRQVFTGISELKSPSSNKYLLVIPFSVILALFIPKTVTLYHVNGKSMSPTLEVGDWVAVKTFVFDSHPNVSQNDVITFQRDGVDYKEIKRVKKIEHEMRETNKQGNGADLSNMRNTYFVAGDNAAESYDSRQYGQIPENNVTGKVLSVVWTRDFTRIGAIAK